MSGVELDDQASKRFVNLVRLVCPVVVHHEINEQSNSALINCAIKIGKPNVC